MTEIYTFQFLEYSKIIWKKGKNHAGRNSARSPTPSSETARPIPSPRPWALAGRPTGRAEGRDGGRTASTRPHLSALRRQGATVTAVRPEPVRVLIEPVAGGGAVHRRLAAGDPVPSPGTDPGARRIQAEKVDVDVDVDGAVWELNGERRGGGSRRGGAPARPGRGRAERERGKVRALTRDAVLT